MKSLNPFLTCALLIAALCLSPPTEAQDNMEGLGPIFERGYVAHWLVCGPFEPDVTGGILAAIRDDAAVLTDTDFMETRGGIARMRPDHLMRIPTADGGESIWQRAGTTGPELDLAPFFPGDPVGIAYAAFYVDSPSLTQILLDLESPLGVRVWSNGFPIADYEPGPLDAVGKTQVAVALRRGGNLIVFEVPGADYTAMARARSLSVEQLTAGAMANRPRLRKTSGFALSLLVHDARGLGKKLLYLPNLKDAGTFSGIADDLKQDMLLTLHNPLTDISEPVQALVTVPGASLPILIEIEALDAGETREIPVAIPLANTSPGSAIPISVRLVSGDAESSFSDTVTVNTGTGDNGVVRVITGHTMAKADGPPSDELYLGSVKRQLLFSEQSPGYGFDLGYAYAWHKPFVAFPELRLNLKRSAQQGAATVRGAYAPIDERVVGGTALWRNLQLGLHMAGSHLNSSTPQYLKWNEPGIAPQTAQLLRLTPMDGILTNLSTPGMAPLSRLYDLTGETLYLRRKLTAPGPATLDDLREMVALQRRELLNQSIATDVLVLENVVAPPEPFYRGNVDELAGAFPRIVLDEGGAARFFEDLSVLNDQQQASIPPATLNLNLGQPGALWSLPVLQHTHAQLAQQLEMAESLATLASLQGSTYPHAAMEFSWRQLLYYSTPETLGVPTDNTAVLDALAGYREVAEWTADSLRRSTEYLAGLINTSGTVPLNQGDFQALVVFNPSGVETTTPVVARIPAAVNTGLRIVDSGGSPIQSVTRPYESEQLIEFVADDLPSYGYNTYFVQSAEQILRPVAGEDTQIENDHLALFLDPKTGAIQSLLDKSNGTEVSGGLLNQILLLPENSAENRDATELWTRGPEGDGGQPSKISSEHSAFYQRLTVTTPLSGGTMEQRYTLYAGVPWVACETVLDGVDLKGRAATASFELPHEGASFLVGERLATVVGARGQADFVLKTREGENAGGTVPYPAHEWVALSTNDAIQVGRGGVVPWEPTIIVYGEDRVLERAARDLQQALITRGIPSILQPDAPTKPDFLWTDGTTEMDSNTYLKAGYRMRVVVGSPDQNRFCGGLIAQLSEPVIRDYAEHIPGGARLLMHDTNVPAGRAPVPTLMLGGLTPAQSAELTDSLTRSVRTGQRYLLPPSAYVPTEIQQETSQGCAILFPGSMSASQQRDGRLLLGLQHSTPLEARRGDAVSMLNETTFRYGIYPFSGTWRDANIPTVAARYNARPVTALTAIHPGELPVQQSFLEVRPEGLRVGGLKPAGFPTTTNTRTAFHPRNGYSLHAWEATGERWSGVLRSNTNVLEARSADVLELPQTPWSVSGRDVNLELGGYAFVPLWFLPSVSRPLDGLARLGREEEPFGVLETRYWDERRGAAPLRKMPLGLLLRGALVGDTPTIEVVVSNHSTDRTVQGTVNLEATSGLSFGPQNFYYSLSPGKQHVEPIHLARTPGMDPEMAVVAETEFERQTYRDVTMTNEAPYVMETTRNGAQIRVEIRNNSSVFGKGYLDAIAAPTHWPELGEFPTLSIAPRRAAVSIPPFKSQTILFSLSEPDASIPVVVKLAANGMVRYERVAPSVSPVQEEAPAPAGAPAPPPPRARN